jgi:tryptophan-rich sensory protein
MKNNNIQKLLISFCIVAFFVLVSLILTKGSMEFYNELDKPKFAPPSWIFPVVWTIIYSILTITLYKFLSNRKITALIIVHLAINVMWPILFFRFELLGVTVYWLVLLIVSLGYLLYQIYKVKPKYAYFNLFYFLWCLFALYLNITLYYLNK